MRKRSRRIRGIPLWGVLIAGLLADSPFSGGGRLRAAPGPSNFTAADVFKTASPSVVLIRDAEGHGSGVVLNPKGTILTNFHVVNTPLPLEVTAEVFRHGVSQGNMTFPKVTIDQVHKDYDLAIIRVSLPDGVQLRPIQRAPSTLTTGQDCYVIGNPGGAGNQVLRNTITAGILSSSERVIENLTYLQTTCAINPGNSGGALVDRSGRLMGIVSFILSDTEGIGFAIPFLKLQTAEFTGMKERKGDPQKAAKLQAIGSEWQDRASFLPEQAREQALQIAYIAFRLALAESPNDPAMLCSVGLLYVLREEYAIGLHFFKRAVELNGGKSPYYLQMYGMCAEETGDIKQAVEAWRRGLLTETKEKIEDETRSACAELLAIAALKQKRPFMAAYLIKWANSLALALPDRASVRSNVLQEAVDQLNETQFNLVSNKAGTFSFEDMAKLEAAPPGTIPAAARAAAPLSAAVSPAPAPKPAAATSANLEAIFKRVLDKAPEPGEEGMLRKLPESFTDCRPALGGAYLIMKFPEMKRLGVFNIAQLKFDKFIPIASPEILYAAGGSLLVVFDPNQNVFELYDLNTFERIGAKVSRIQGVLTDIEMGLHRSDKALISWANGRQALDGRHYGWLDLASMRTVSFFTTAPGYASPFRNDHYRDNIHMRLDSDLSRMTMWCTSHSPSGFLHATFDGDKVNALYEHGSYDCLTLLRDRSRIVSSMGKLVDPKGGIRHDFGANNVMLFAVDGANLVVKISGQDAVVVDAINLTELRKFKVPVKLAPIPWAKDHLTLDRLVFASAHLNRVAVLDNANQQIAVFKLLESPGAGAGALPGAAKPGQLWTLKLNFAPGAKVRVEDAPAGVKFNPQTMSLAWQVPANAPQGSHLILLSVVEPEKEEVYHRVTVEIP